LIASIVIGHNPVALWERFSLTLTRHAERNGFSAYNSEQRRGGFWKASFVISADRAILAEMMRNGLGRNVVAYNEEMGIDFEGYINTMRLMTGVAVAKTTLDTVFNKVWLRYKNTGGTLVRSVVASDATSQARFGVKERVLSGGEIASSSVADNYASRYVSLRRNPRILPESVRLAGSNKENPQIEVDVFGYIHTLFWRVYNQTASAGTQGASSEVNDILTAVGQFVASRSISPNSTTVTKEYDADRWAAQIIFDIAELGDASLRRWVAYMKRQREFVFSEAAPPEVLV